MMRRELADGRQPVPWWLIILAVGAFLLWQTMSYAHSRSIDRQLQELRESQAAPAERR
jgi:hypothetical protein